MKRSIILLIILMSLLSCNTNKNIYSDLKSYQFGKIDLSKKTITIRSGGDYFLSKIKYVLSKHGWQVENYFYTEVKDKDEKREVKYAELKTRYTLILTYILTTGKHYKKGKIINDYVQLPSLTIVDNETRSDILIIFSKEGVSARSFAIYFHKKLNELENVASH